ncbi:polysaccharide deacetylase family protein [Treponema socranskii]|uniref:polysaccharide deacetylase family protein n=1 Tax=Treponema socranskii TaxID=53419 RepID=UPI003D6E82F7
MENKLYISMYHYTRDLAHSRYPEIKGLAYDLFEKQLQFFKRNFSVVTMEEVISAIQMRGGQCKLPENPILLTFDDGYIDNFTVALPLLKKYGMQGSFFIPGKTFSENVLLDVNKVHFVLASASDPKELVSDINNLLDKARRNPEYSSLPSNQELYVHYGIANRFDGADVVFCKRILQTVIPEKLRNEMSSKLFAKYVGLSESNFARELYMNPDQIKFMKDNGMFIGLHGYDHYWLGNLTPDEMKRDVDKALEVMSPFINKNAWVMNYPYGSYNQDVIDYIKSRDCVLGLTTQVAPAVLTDENRFTLQRLDCNDFPPKSENYLKY